MMRSFLLKVKSKSGVVETMTPSTLNLNDFEALVVASDYSTQDRHQTYPTVIFIPKGPRRSSSNNSQNAQEVVCGNKYVRLWLPII